MAQAARVNQDNGELDASVGALIDQLEGEGDGSLDLTPEATVEGGMVNGPGDALAPPPMEDDLLLSVQQLLSEVPVGPAVVPPPDPGVEEAAVAELELPADFVAPAKAPAPAAKQPPAAASPADASRIESLDQELAGIADELISTEIAAEPEPEDAGETLEKAVQAVGAVARELEQLDDPGEEPEPAPVAAPVSAPPAEAPVPEPKPRERWALLGVLARPALAACAAISAPLRDRPQHVRDIVGWNALWLAFLGVCVWSYVLFIRSPEPRVPTLLPTSAKSVEKAAGGHGAKKDSHAAKSDHGGKGKAEKKSTHAKADAKKKSGGHH